ncbi:MAG: conserved phage C-terminal domain-containing protein [Devosiaceae bacterium]|nr:conserved phage C-terminal domain-containing protein [Devosiaceae bacterium]
MAETAQLFEIDNVRRFRKFWSACTELERHDISDFIKREMGEEIIDSLTKKELDSQAEEVINFLNHKTGKRFRIVDIHMKHIKARLKSGITLQELKAIIAKKSRDWKGTDSEEYLRPATLFNATKCENYLGELS